MKQAHNPKLARTQQDINLFNKAVKAFLGQGESVDVAVRKAYNLYPIMQRVAKDISVQIKKSAEEGLRRKLLPGEEAGLQLAWAPDKLTLSERTTRGDGVVQSMVANAIVDAVKEGKTIQQTALSIFDGYGHGGVIPKQDIPKYMDKLRRILKKDRPLTAEDKYNLRKAERQINALTTPSLRAAYKGIKTLVDERNAERLQKAVDVATHERTRYFASRIARTELARAYHDGCMARWMDDDDVVAVQWKLSTAHPCHDICDVYANADLYNLGKGIFPKDKVPILPAHPNCMCRLKPIIQGNLDGKIEEERIEAGGRKYLYSLPLFQRQRLLGVHGAKAVDMGVSWTAKARGYSERTLESRLVEVPDLLKPFVKDGKINIEEFGQRRDDEDDIEFERRIWAYIKSMYCTKAFTPRQELHYRFSNKYVDGKSYYNESLDLEKIVECLYDGEIRKTTSGNWKKQVLIDIPDIIGVVVTKDGKKEFTTTKAIVHIGNKGIHVVPKKV